MNILKTLMALSLIMTPALAQAQVQIADQNDCEDGTTLNEDDECVAAVILTDDLGLPVGTEVTNFAPFVLPALAVVGAVVAAGVANGGGEGDGSTNGTN